MSKSKKLNARKGQILFLLSGIHAQILRLTYLIDCYIIDQAKSDNPEEHLTSSQVFFLQRLSGSLKGIYRVLIPRIEAYRSVESGLINSELRRKRA